VIALQPAPAITPTLAAPAQSVETAPTSLDVLPAPGSGSQAPPPAGVLPDPELELLMPEMDGNTDSSPTPDTIPPVTVATVLRPARLLWLFVIGLLVFTVTYGLQVIVWYRLKR
jgi:hypothetical protein